MAFPCTYIIDYIQGDSVEVPGVTASPTHEDIVQQDDMELVIDFHNGPALPYASTTTTPTPVDVPQKRSCFVFAGAGGQEIGRFFMDEVRGYRVKA